MNKSLMPALAVALLMGCSGDPGSAQSPATGRIGHVFIIVLENENYATSFDPVGPAPYLAVTLPSKGQLLRHYYGTGHVSLDNYISMTSGQGPNFDTQSDCQYFTDFAGPPVPLDADGQATGRGCVFPANVLTIADQLEAAGLTWRAYMDDMGKDPSRGGETTTCSHPAIGSQDHTQSANAVDQYATRHNPFMYYHSIIDDQARCDAHVVQLNDSTLTADLASVATTPNYVFITPDLCNDGHDAPCADGNPGGLEQVNTFLQEWVPKIMNSPAFGQDGLLIVTFDEAENSDATDCSSATGTGTTCSEPIGPNSPSPGITGPGGGRVGAVLVSPLIQAGSVNDNGYNHYSMLRSIEDIFGLAHLGFAGNAGTPTFGNDVFNASQ